MSIVFAESAWDVISAFLVFVSGAIYFIQRPIKSISANQSILLYLWHTLFCVVYAVFTIYNTADAPGYFMRSLNPQIALGVGTRSVDAFTAILTQGLQLSYIGAFFVFNIIGTIGLVAFASALRETLATKSLNVQWIGLLLLFLPGVSFWSSAIGKDAPAFMATGLMCWAILNMKRRWILVVLSLAIYAIVRPHVVAIILVALALATICAGKLSPAKKVASIIILAAPIAFGLQIAITSAGLDGAFSNVQELVDYRQSVNLEGQGAIDISSMILPLQMFFYAFGPLIIGASGLMGMLASIENAFLLFVILLSVSKMIRGKSTIVPVARWFYLFFTLMLWVVFATTTANLGISLRQKWMFMPMLLILCMSYLPDIKRKIATALGSRILVRPVHNS